MQWGGLAQKVPLHHFLGRSEYDSISPSSIRDLEWKPTIQCHEAGLHAIREQALPGSFPSIDTTVTAGVFLLQPPLLSKVGETRQTQGNLLTLMQRIRLAKTASAFHVLLLCI
jgi:hypothetical protein